MVAAATSRIHDTSGRWGKYNGKNTVETESAYGWGIRCVASSTGRLSCRQHRAPCTLIAGSGPAADRRVAPQFSLIWFSAMTAFQVLI